MQHNRVSFVTQPINYCTGFPGGLEVKHPPAIPGYVGSIPGLGRSLGGGDGNPLHILAWKICGQRRLGGCKELDTT